MLLRKKDETNQEHEAVQLRRGLSIQIASIEPLKLLTTKALHYEVEKVSGALKSKLSPSSFSREYYFVLPRAERREIGSLWYALLPLRPSHRRLSCFTFLSFSSSVGSSPVLCPIHKIHLSFSPLSVFFPSLSDPNQESDENRVSYMRGGLQN